MEIVIFAIVILHIVVGFGWAIYQLEIKKNKPTKKEN